MRTANRQVFLAVAVATMLFRATSAAADVVEPPPENCPEGYTPMTGHGGPYCQPPPPVECPVGYEPKVYRTESYCEPPPPVVCPPGSEWESRSATDYFCRGGYFCDPDVVTCGAGYACVESSLCVTQISYGNYYMEIVSGRCTGPDDCQGTEQCVTQFRCDPLVKRQPVPEAPPPPQDPIVPAPSPTTSTGSSSSSGCGCRTAPANGDPTGLWGVALGALVALGRRRRQRA